MNNDPKFDISVFSKLISVGGFRWKKNIDYFII